MTEVHTLRMSAESPDLLDKEGDMVPSPVCQHTHHSSHTSLTMQINNDDVMEDVFAWLGEDIVRVDNLEQQEREEQRKAAEALAAKAEEKKQRKVPARTHAHTHSHTHLHTSKKPLCTWCLYI